MRSARRSARTLVDAPPCLATTRFVIELGRWLVGEAGVYLTRIVDRKESRGKTFLVTDGGLHHMLAASGNFGQLLRRNYPVAIASRFAAPAEEEASIVGCLCTPLDLLADEVALPQAEVGDLVAIFCAGAYGLSASPQAFLSQPRGAGNAGLGVDRLDEIQAFGRRVEPERGAVARFQRRADIVRAAIARARPAPGSRPSSAPGDGGSCAPRRGCGSRRRRARRPARRAS